VIRQSIVIDRRFAPELRCGDCGVEMDRVSQPAEGSVTPALSVACEAQGAICHLSVSKSREWPHGQQPVLDLNVLKKVIARIS
jgi:hypothetical protein